MTIHLCVQPGGIRKPDEKQVRILSLQMCDSWCGSYVDGEVSRQDSEGTKSESQRNAADSLNF